MTEIQALRNWNIAQCNTITNSALEAAEQIRYLLPITPTSLQTK